MLNRDHVVVSETIFTGIETYYGIHGIVPIGQGIIGIWLGSQLPDIDTTSSIVGKRTKPISTLISKFGHRGITHTLWMALLVAYGMYELALIFPNFKFLFLWLAGGYAMHLIEDWFSKSGLVWFFPFFHKQYYAWKPGHGQPKIYCRRHINKWFRYKTGGRKEKIIRFISLVLLCIIIIYYFNKF